MQEKGMLPCDAAAHGKSFIVGGNRAAPADTCEVYNEQLSEWQIIGRLSGAWSLEGTRSAVWCVAMATYIY